MVIILLETWPPPRKVRKQLMKGVNRHIRQVFNYISVSLVTEFLGSCLGHSFIYRTGPGANQYQRCSSIMTNPNWCSG